jgi:hypothetical protein
MTKRPTTMSMKMTTRMKKTKMTMTMTTKI